MSCWHSQWQIISQATSGERQYANAEIAFPGFLSATSIFYPGNPLQSASSISPEPRVHNFIKSNLGSTEPIMNRKQINKLKTGCASKSCHCLSSLFSSITGIGWEGSRKIFCISLSLSAFYFNIYKDRQLILFSL